MATKKAWAGDAEMIALFEKLCERENNHVKEVFSAKLKAVVNAAFKYQNEFKMVVYEVENFIKKSPVQNKIYGLYALDSICKKSRGQFSKEKDIYSNRFAIRLKDTIGFLEKISEKEKVSLRKVIEDWGKQEIFPRELLQSLKVETRISAKPTFAQSPNDSSDSEGEGGAFESIMARVQPPPPTMSKMDTIAVGRPPVFPSTTMTSAGSSHKIFASQQQQQQQQVKAAGVPPMDPRRRAAAAATAASSSSSSSSSSTISSSYAGPPPSFAPLVAPPQPPPMPPPQSMAVKQTLPLATSTTGQPSSVPPPPPPPDIFATTQVANKAPPSLGPLRGEVKKAVRLCPFREGSNCPFSDKCRFSHYESNTLESYSYSRALLRPKEREALQSTSITTTSKEMAGRMRFSALDAHSLEVRDLLDPQFSFPKRELEFDDRYHFSPEVLVPAFKRIKVPEIHPSQIFSFKNAGQVYLISKSNFDKIANYN